MDDDLRKEARSYQDLTVWQKSMDLVVLIYELTKDFPPDQKFGLVNQMQRAAVSIPSNIAEGSRRRSEADNIRFLRISFGSASELETQILISQRLRFGHSEKYPGIKSLLLEILKMLNKMSDKP